VFTDRTRAALLDGVARTELAPPARIRRRGAIRTWRQVAVGSTAAVALIAGAGVVYARQPTAAPTPPPPGASRSVDPAPVPNSSPPDVPSAPPSSPPASSPSSSSSSGQGSASGIPDSVLLRSADVNDAPIYPADLAYWRNGRRIPPHPCAGTPPDTRRTAERGIQILLPSPPSGQPHVVVEYVARYDGDGARDAMSQLRTELQTCPGQGNTQSPSWTGLGPIGVGDDSLMVRYTMFGGYDGDPATKTEQYLAVVRIGRVFLVLASVGWETGGGDATTARDFAAVAADRLRPIA
jgi:hypothetical protein